jgi:hypothetical protein
MQIFLDPVANVLYNGERRVCLLESIDEAEIEDQARDILRSDAGPYVHHIVGKALQAGERLVNFADEWWPADKLPYRVTWDEVALVRDLLHEQAGGDGAPSPVSPADLAQLLWDVSPEDIPLMRLTQFTLNCALASHKDFRYLRARRDANQNPVFTPLPG